MPNIVKLRTEDPQRLVLIDVEKFWSDSPIVECIVGYEDAATEHDPKSGEPVVNSIPVVKTRTGVSIANS